MSDKGTEVLMKSVSVRELMLLNLTKRELFAAMAMCSPRNPCNAHEHEASSEWAHKEADALLAELAKEQSE